MQEEGHIGITTNAAPPDEAPVKSGAANHTLLVEHNTAQLWTARPDGGLDYVNPRVAAYAGLEAHRLLGNEWGRMVHPLDLSRAVQQWRHCLETGEPYCVEMRLQQGSDARYRWHLTTAKPVRDAAGAIVQWVGTNVDIDDQKRATEVAAAGQVRANMERERLQRAFHHSPAALFLLHGPSFVIDMLNPKAHALIGERVVLGKPVREALPEVEGQGVFDLLEHVYATGEACQVKEMRLLVDRRGDGALTEAFWDMTLQPLNEPGEPVSDILSHAVEVTELVLLRQRAGA